MVIIAFANSKGGSGKTTLSAAVALELSAQRTTIGLDGSLHGDFSRLLLGGGVRGDERIQAANETSTLAHVLAPKQVSTLRRIFGAGGAGPDLSAGEEAPGNQLLRVFVGTPALAHVDDNGRTSKEVAGRLRESLTQEGAIGIVDLDHTTDSFHSRVLLHAADVIVCPCSTCLSDLYRLFSGPGSLASVLESEELKIGVVVLNKLPVTSFQESTELKAADGTCVVPFKVSSKTAAALEQDILPRVLPAKVTAFPLLPSSALDGLHDGGNIVGDNAAESVRQLANFLLEAAT